MITTYHKIPTYQDTVSSLAKGPKERDAGQWLFIELFILTNKLIGFNKNISLFYSHQIGSTLYKQHIFYKVIK